MTDQMDQAMNDFIDHMHVFRYPQTVVCDTVTASLIDLNEWRRREILPKEGYEKRGRIIYTGAMLLRAGFLAELAPIIGPSEASRFADMFLSSVPFDLTGIKGKVAVFQPRRGEHFSIIWTDASDTLEPFNHAKIVFPIGLLIKQWMVGAELRMQNA